MEQKFEVKDLINVGIYTALYFVVSFIVACLGFIPIFWVMVPFLCPLVAGIPLMLYFSKIKHFGMITISAVIIAILQFITGHPWIIFVFVIGAGLLTELVLWLFKYQSIKGCVIGSSVFSLWYLGMLIVFFFGFREDYMAYLQEGYGQQYVDTLSKLMPEWLFWVYIPTCLIAGAIGGLIGAKVLKKHFRKAGMV